MAACQTVLSAAACTGGSSVGEREVVGACVGGTAFPGAWVPLAS